MHVKDLAHQLLVENDGMDPLEEYLRSVFPWGAFRLALALALQLSEHLLRRLDGGLGDLVLVGECPELFGILLEHALDLLPRWISLLLVIEERLHNHHDALGARARVLNRTYLIHGRLVNLPSALDGRRHLPIHVLLVQDHLVHEVVVLHVLEINLVQVGCFLC